MNDLIRPTLYDAYHRIGPVKETDAAEIACDIVGPVCETGDFFARGRALPLPASGDLLAVYSAGAYGAVQAGTYNYPPAGAGSAGERRRIRRRPPAPDLRGADRARPPAGLAGLSFAGFGRSARARHADLLSGQITRLCVATVVGRDS